MTIEVDVHEFRTPGPTGGVEASLLRRLRPGAVIVSKQERVSVHLHRDLDGAGWRPDFHQGRDLRFPEPAREREHVRHEDIGGTVGVDVGEGDGHRSMTRFSQRPRTGQPEGSCPVVDPQLGRTLEVVGDVEVRRAVAVEVAEARGQSPLLRLYLQRLTFSVEESTP